MSGLQAGAGDATRSGQSVAAALPRLARAAAAPAGVIALAAALFLFHLGSYGLWEPDEARYAEIAREMIVSHDYVLPHLNYVPYVEKPPLLYWLTAAHFRILGETEFAARLISARSAVLGVLVTMLFTMRVFDRRRAMLASAILATSPLYAVMAQVLTTDMLLASLITIAIFAFYLHWSEGRRWRWLMYGAMGLAALAKGPVGVVLPILVALIFLWWNRDLWGGLRKLGLPSGLLLTTAITAPWFAAVAMRQPGFVQFYFIGEHLRRFIEPRFSHGAPIYFYVPVLLVGMVPWTLLAPLCRPPRERDPRVAFTAISASVTFIFFSLASGKLVSYILPVLPPLAILLADRVISYMDARRAEHRRPLGPPMLAGLPLVVLGIAAIAVAVWTPDASDGYLALIRPSLTAIGLIMIIGGCATAAIFFAGRSDVGLAAMALTAAAILIAGSYSRLAIESKRSYAQLSRDVARLAPDAGLICYHRYVQALPFYARRRVILVGPPSELRFGAGQSPDAHSYFFEKDADLIQLWHEKRPRVLVIDEPDLARLAPALGQVRVIASEHRKRAVVRADN
jgi:4-amino-4-deoxy-L-arabinose transferase-like glycosyltransferase